MGRHLRYCVISSYLKVELVARAFTAAEMDLPAVISNKKQLNRLYADYLSRIVQFHLPATRRIERTKKFDVVIVWSRATLAHIFLNVN